MPRRVKAAPASLPAQKNLSHLMNAMVNDDASLHLAVQNTGRGGTGSREAGVLQREIIGLLLKASANPKDRDGRGKTVRQAAQSNWISIIDLSTERN